MKQLICLVSVFLISACGGGGGSEQPVSKAPAVVETPPADTQEQGVAALNVPTQFDFKTDFTVTVNVAANLVNERAFINICEADAALTNADTCFVRSPLTDNGLEMSFTLPHQGQKVKASIWFYDTSRAPLNYEWQFNSSQSEQMWRIN